MALEELKLLEEQIDKLEQEMASLLSAHHHVVQRLAEVRTTDTAHRRAA